MINSDQLRAARALLDWKTADLAEKSGMTVNGINKIERGYVQGRRETMETLQKVFEEAGLEFLPGSGVRKKDRYVTTYEGADAQRILVEDIFNTLQSTQGEMLVAHLDEGCAIKNLEINWLKEEIRKRRAAGITQRLLVRADDENLIPPFDTYRAIPSEFFSPYPLYIYGSKIALVSGEPSPRVIIIDDERFSESTRKLFNFIWQHAMPLTSEIINNKE